MRNTPSPRRIIRSSDTNGNNVLADNSCRTKPQSAFSYTLKTAIQRLARLFTCQSKFSSKPEDSRRPGQAIGIPPDSIDNSTESRSNSLLKLNSSGKSTSTQVAAVAYSIEEILKATHNFSPENKLGEGGFGTVYKGKLKDGSFVAVKRAKKDVYKNHLFAEFKNEILTLSKIEHLNLVRLFGYLEHGDEKIIVVEYVGNGTLLEHLDGTRGSELEMAERLDIAIDVAHAVTYLHMYTDRPIIHRDIKSSNILITEKLRAKVADFGFARLAAEDPAATHISTQVKGTVGYLDPEYLKTYQLTEKSDVYSFGVVLVELMTGRQPLQPKRVLKERVTTRWAMQSLKDGVAVVAMDLRMRRNPESVRALEKVLRLARHCLAPERQSRPSMKQCGEVLWRIRKDFREKNHLDPASTSHYSENIDVRKDHRNMFGIEDDESHGFRSA